MAPTATKDQPADRSTRDGDLDDQGAPPARDDGPAGHGGAGRDGQASFALFASFLAVLLALAALLAVAFKLDENQQSGTAALTQPLTPTAASGALSIDMGDYFYSPESATVTAGKLKLAVVNKGQLPHELVLARTDAEPSQLPTKPDGSVDEAKLQSPGEVPDVAPGATKRGAIKLSPGRYVMFCNLPGHYAQGMYGSVNVD